MNAVNQRRDDIQGLRALAVLAVIIYHVNHKWLPGGFIGVDIFFVISGYLITGIVLRQKAESRFSFTSFYASRLRRIVPAYLFLLASVAAAMAVLLIPRDFNTFFDSLKSAAYFSSNNYFSKQSDYFAPASHELPLLHTWSLAVEMQFYLFLPALVVMVPTRFLKGTLGLIAALLFMYSAILLANGEKQAVYFSLIARTPEFLVGAFLAASGNISGKSSYRNIKAWIGFVLISLSFILISEKTTYPGFLALAPCIGTALLISASGSTINNFLASGPAAFVGAISYSLYLWHWPVLAGYRYYYEAYDLPAVVLLACAVLVAALSIASYVLIENPLRQVNGRKGALKLAAFAAIAFLAVIISKTMNPMVTKPLPVEMTRYAARKDICHGQIVGKCLRGDLSATTEILLLGDSHAAQLNHFADEIGKALGVRIRVITASSCVPIEGFDAERIPEWARQPCESQIAVVKPYIESADAVLLAGMWQFHEPSERFMLALEKFMTATAKREQPLVVLAQIPMLTSNVQRMQRFNALGSSKSTHLEGTWQKANWSVAKKVGGFPNATFLDLTSLPLFETPPLSNGELIYHDSHHLNEIGSKAYGEAASTKISDALRGIGELQAVSAHRPH